jgi:hypothetical protein
MYDEFGVLKKKFRTKAKQGETQVLVVHNFQWQISGTILVDMSLCSMGGATHPKKKGLHMN